MKPHTVQTNGNEYTAISSGEIADKLFDEYGHGQIMAGWARLLFLGQAWIDGFAKTRDEERYAYCVPLTDLHLSNDGWMIGGLDKDQHPHYVSDDLRFHKNAPISVREYSGPFEIKVSHIGTDAEATERDDLETYAEAMEHDDSEPYTPCPRCQKREGYTWSESVAVSGDVYTGGSGRPMPETERQTNVHSKGTPTCSACKNEIPLSEF